MSAPVPKFSSFRPKAPAVKETTPHADDDAKASRKSNHTSQTDKKRKSQSHVPEDGQAKNHRHDHGRRRLEDEQGKSTIRPSVQSPKYDAGNESPYFFSDNSGDPKNLTYGSLHRYSIPSYHRVGYGNILGLPRRYKIDREASTEGSLVVVQAGRRSGIRQERALLKRQRNPIARILRISHDARSETIDSHQDFISLGYGGRKRKRGSESPQGTSGLGGSRDYRSIEGEATSPAKPEDSDLEVASLSDQDAAWQSVDDDAREKNAELVREVRKTSKNIHAWRDLIQHQADMVRPGVDLRDFTNTERRTLVDIRLSIYAKALKEFTPESSDGRLLLQEMLNEGSKTWDRPTIAQKWQDALRADPGNHTLWTRYLDVLQDEHVDFRYEVVKHSIVECLGRLKDVLASGTSPGKEASVAQCLVILRMTAYVRDAGYEELSIALWQALFEFHVFRPDHLSGADQQGVLAAFEEFWNSESPRFGEAGAQGWRAGATMTTGLEVEEAAVPINKPLSRNMPFRSFALAEELASQSVLPGRTMDEIGSDDPYHLILFTDIKDVFESLPEGLDLDMILDAFLCFCRLPPRLSISSVNDHVHLWRSDSHLSGLVSLAHSAVTSGSDCMPAYQMSTDVLFSSAFQDVIWSGVPEYLLFVRRGLTALVYAHPDDHLAEYLLAFELCHYPKEYVFTKGLRQCRADKRIRASKTARSLLKQRSSSLRLYNACALIEASLGRVDKAAHIWRTATRMSKTFSQEARQDLVLLQHSWAWSDMRCGSRSSAVLHLVDDVQDDGNVKDENVSLAARLRAKRALTESFHHALSHSNIDLAALCSSCLALLAYTTESDSLSASIEAIQAHCDAVSSSVSGWAQANRQALLELIHQSKAAIFAYHIAKQRPYKPAFIRAELEESISQFPANTILLQLHALTEQRHRLDDRVRSIMRERVFANETSNILGWSFTLSQEINRYQRLASGSTAEAVRSVFCRALLSVGSRVAHAPRLWDMWFRFEERGLSTLLKLDGTNEREIARAMRRLKQVFLDGLRCLPWVKEWVLMGLRFFDRDDGLGWSMADLKRLWNVMIERELRLRTEGFEDLLDDIADGTH